MEIIILGFCVILLGLYGSKAVMLHRGYKNHLYAVLFASYLEYFYRNVIRHDCSTSNLVKEKLGTHKMSFTTIQNREGNVTSHYVLLFYNKGIACISYLNPKGIVSGKTSDKGWVVEQSGKKIKIVNPVLECQKYSQRLKRLCPKLNVKEYIACPDDCDIHRISGSIYHYSDILDTLKSVNLPYISEELILAEYENANSQKGK